MQDSLKGREVRVSAITLADSQLRGHATGLVRQNVEVALTGFWTQRQTFSEMPGGMSVMERG